MGGKNTCFFKKQSYCVIEATITIIREKEKLKVEALNWMKNRNRDGKKRREGNGKGNNGLKYDLPCDPSCRVLQLNCHK